MVDKGIDREIAYEVMESVRKGKVASGTETKRNTWKELLKTKGIPDWFIKQCEEIHYLFPKGHIAKYINDSLEIAYYKENNPEIFKMLTDRELRE